LEEGNGGSLPRSRGKILTGVGGSSVNYLANSSTLILEVATQGKKRGADENSEKDKWPGRKRGGPLHRVGLGANVWGGMEEGTEN